MSQQTTQFTDEVSQVYKELYSESISAGYESNLDKPWQDATEVRTHFFWGDKGGGKSTSMEESAEIYHRAGLNIWHVWSGRSLENFMWPVSLNCEAKWERKMQLLPEDLRDEFKSRLHCSCHDPIPSVLVFPDYKPVDMTTVRQFNIGFFRSREEYIYAVEKGFVSPDLSFANKILLDEGRLPKPESMKPEIDLIKIAYVTIPRDEASREIFKAQWIKIVLDAKEEHRPVLLTPQIFEGDKDKFLVVGEIFKLLPDIAMEHFTEMTPERVGQMRGLPFPVPKFGIPERGIPEWTDREKGYDKIVIVANELGTIAPNNKYSRQVESKNAKRPVVDMIPEVRHFGKGVYFMGDLQNPDDLNGSVRPQADSVIIKRATKDLLGSEFTAFFAKIDEVRRRKFAYWGFEVKSDEDEKKVPPEVLAVVNRDTPKIEELPKNKGYIVFRNGEYFLETFGMPSFHHRKEGETFRELTGIRWSLNKKKVEKEGDDKTKSKSKRGTANDEESPEFKILEMLVDLKINKEKKLDYEKGKENILEMIAKDELPKDYADSPVLGLNPKALSKKINRIPKLKQKIAEAKKAKV